MQQSLQECDDNPNVISVCKAVLHLLSSTEELAFLFPYYLLLVWSQMLSWPVWNLPEPARSSHTAAAFPCSDLRYIAPSYDTTAFQTEDFRVLFIPTC